MRLLTAVAEVLWWRPFTDRAGLLGSVLLAASALAGPSVPTGAAWPELSERESSRAADTTELLLYRSTGWRYRVLRRGDVPPRGYELPSFEDSSWATGTAAFGFATDRPPACAVQAAVKTRWPIHTVLLARRRIDVPAGATNLRVLIAVDNDALGVYFNGAHIGAARHSYCPDFDDFVFEVPRSLVRAGE